MKEKLYRAVVETMQDGFLLVDTGGTILAVNPAFEAMTGYSSRELVGRPCTVLNCTGCEILGRGKGENWCSLFRKGRIRSRRCEILPKAGSPIYVIKDATVLRDDSGRLTGAVETLADITELVRREQELTELRRTFTGAEAPFGMVGTSAAMQRLVDLIENAAHSAAPVLIYGESGVGKELVARAIHDAGPRARGSFIRVNCASLNENLLESELFGHVRGAFTGADRNRIGRFEAAAGGSIFLDEIGDISPALQVKLLRVLESKEIERVGDHRPLPVDVRIITATNKDLEHLVAAGSFREDLFFRINVIPIFVPPLRERREDIPLLAKTFIDRIAARSGKPIEGITPEALNCMLVYHWPGNVRELLNAIEYSFVLCPGELIGLEHLPPRLSGAPPSCPAPASLHFAAKTNVASPRALKERQQLIQALQEAGGNRTAAARLLGISRVTLWKRMKKHGVVWEP